MAEITEILERIAREKAEQQERKILKDYTEAGKITPQGLNTAIKEMQTATIATKLLVIANATTAAAKRKAIPEVEIIITKAAETGTVYAVKDTALKQQLFTGIERRGY